MIGWDPHGGRLSHFFAFNLSGLFRLRTRARILAVLMIAAFAVAAGLVAERILAAKPSIVTMSAGNTEGIWYQFLLGLARDTTHKQLRITPTVTKGSLEMLERVDRGALDFALIQGGYDLERYRNVRQVAGLSVIPLHLLVKREYRDAALTDLGSLRGKTVNLGSGKQTGTYWLAREVLAFASLPPEAYRATAMSSDALRDQRDRSKLPDAVFIVTMPPSTLVRHLVSEFDYALVPLPIGDAFRLGALDRVGIAPTLADGILVRKEHIADAVIPAYAYGASPAVPPQTITTLGIRILLVTNRHTDHKAVLRMLETLLSSAFAKQVQPPLDAGVVRVAAEVPWHRGAIEFRDRSEPLITGDVIGIASNTLQILVPVGGGLLFFWGWLRNRVLARREERFDRFIALVSGVERRAHALERGKTRDRAAIRKLHRELSAIKDGALMKIAKGESTSNALVTSLFAHIADVRTFLAELDRHWSDRRIHEE